MLLQANVGSKTFYLQPSIICKDTSGQPLIFLQCYNPSKQPRGWVAQVESSKTVALGLALPATNAGLAMALDNATRHCGTLNQPEGGDVGVLIAGHCPDNLDMPAPLLDIYEVKDNPSEPLDMLWFQF